MNVHHVLQASNAVVARRGSSATIVTDVRIQGLSAKIVVNARHDSQAIIVMNVHHVSLVKPAPNVWTLILWAIIAMNVPRDSQALTVMNVSLDSQVITVMNVRQVLRVKPAPNVPHPALQARNAR